MAATISSLVSDTKRNRLSLIGALTEDQILHVWEKVAEFVETLMLHQKGVSIGGLGMFTFSKRSIEVGNNRTILIQRPVFVLSEKFKQTHSLHCVKKHTSGQVPVHTLNYTQLSNETGVSRELVEGAVREVLQALSRAVAANKTVEFDLKNVGRLTVHDGKAKMSFFREFIFRLDGCCDMEGVFCTSTDDGSICSIMSNPQSPYSRPSTTLSLPHIVQPLATDEDGETSLSLECSAAERSPSSAGDPSNYEATRLSWQLEQGLATISEENEEERAEEGEALKAGVFTVDKDTKISAKASKLDVSASEKASKVSKTSRPTLAPTPAMLMVSRESRKPASSHQHSSNAYTQRRDQGSYTQSCKTRTTSSGSCSCSLVPTSVSRPSTCSHKSSTGQELCYLCHQRAVRNVPVDLSKERAATEKMYTDALHEYQRRSELLAMARAQADKTKRRLIEQEVASFNQTTAEKSKKQKEVKSSEMDPSYIFCERSITPAPYASQQRYCRELDTQVEAKVTRRERERSETEKIGREEQKRLTRELIAYEELNQRMKAQAVEQYKAALNEQTCLKKQATDPLPKNHTHQKQQHPVFGVRQPSPELSERERAKAFFLDQLAMVDEKQRRVREKTLKTLQEDAEILKATKEGLKKDLHRERSRRVKARQALEEEWLASMREKQSRLLEELHRAREQGIRLHQQCERYLRCKQCQRKRENMGKSNILHETRYISGSRLMV